MTTKSDFYKLTFTIIITTMIVGGAVYAWQNQQKPDADTDQIMPTTTKIIQANTDDKIRKITTDGYVINDQLFFSPSMEISFTGILKTLKFENNQFTAENWPGLIEVFQKKDGEEILGAVENILKAKGVNPEDCNFDIAGKDDGNSIIQISPKKVFAPTETDLFEMRKKEMPSLKTLADYRKICAQSPECEFDKAALTQEYNQKICSTYAISTGYHDRSYFQFGTEGNGSKTFIYVHDQINGGDRSWIDRVDFVQSN